MTREQAEFIKKACDFVEIVCEMRDKYSGRGMFGKTTFAVVVPSELEVIGAVVAYLRDSFEGRTSTRNEIPQLDDLSRDSMGRDVVLY